eukprot:6126693-Alexandrium_andersonii.AAC.1
MCIRDSARPTPHVRTDSSTLRADRDARRRRSTEPGDAERLSSRYRSRTGEGANGRAVHAGSPYNKVTTPDVEHRRLVGK